MLRVAGFPRQPARIAKRGGRVFLRPPDPDDRDEYHALRRASKAFLRRFGMDESPARNFDVFLDQGPGTTRERWLICAREGGTILGAITLAGLRREPFHSAVIGYWIGAPHARKGYMHEAVALIVPRVFGALRLHRLEGDVLPGNVASKKVLARAGFKREGLSRDYAHVRGRWLDHERWSLLARDLAKAQRPQSRK